MKKLNLLMLSLFMTVSLLGCSRKSEPMKKDNTVEKDVKKGVDKAERKTEKTLDDLMNYMKGEGVTYSEDKKINDINWGAREGRSFMYDNQNVYIYEVDTKDQKVAELLRQAKENNRVTASQNGQNMQYGAAVNGNYLMIYDKEAQLDQLVEIFKKYDINRKK